MKKGISILLITLLALLGIFLIDSQFRSKEGQTAAVAAETNKDLLASLLLTQLDGSQIRVSELKAKKVLVYIQPDCERCESRAEQMQAHAKAFKDLVLFFFSDAPLPQLTETARIYKSKGLLHNARFAQADRKDMEAVLGSVEAPAVFVLTAQGKVVHAFSADTPMEVIVKSL